jgi:hypothetical protein
MDSGATMTDVQQNAVSSPSSYVAACLATPQATGSLPPATYTPGDPDDLLAVMPWPCNVCISTPSASGMVWDTSTFPPILKSKTVPAVTTVLGPSDNPASWTCDRFHSGCYDMCMIATDAQGVEHTTVVRSAPQIKGYCGEMIQ